VSAPQEAAQELAKMALDKMRGGSVLAVSPQRSEAILAGMFETVLTAGIVAVSLEREACAACTDVDGISAREAGERIRARGTK
jgi:predicted phage tail protein